MPGRKDFPDHPDHSILSDQRREDVRNMLCGDAPDRVTGSTSQSYLLCSGSTMHANKDARHVRCHRQTDVSMPTDDALLPAPRAGWWIRFGHFCRSLGTVPAFLAKPHNAVA